MQVHSIAAYNSAKDGKSKMVDCKWYILFQFRFLDEQRAYLVCIFRNNSYIVSKLSKLEKELLVILLIALPCRLLYQKIEDC